MTDKRITLLNTSKSRLGSAIKRFRQATDLIDEFFKEVFPDQEKPDWNALAPEYHLLDDYRNGIHGIRQQTIRLLYQILHVKRIECRRLEPKGEPERERTRQVVDMLRRMADTVEAKVQASQEDGKRDRELLEEAHALIDKVKNP